VSEVLASHLLFDALKAQFAVDDLTTAFAWGRKEEAKQINQGPGGANRIVFAPGNETGDFGAVLAPDKPGRNPRPLATVDELGTFWLWAVSPDVNTERAQDRAARILYDQWLRAVYLVTHTDGDAGLGPVRIVSQHWNLDKIERSFGREIIVVVAIAAMVPDESFFETTEVDGIRANVPVLENGVSMTIIAPTA